MKVRFFLFLLAILMILAGHLGLAVFLIIAGLLCPSEHEL